MKLKLSSKKETRLKEMGNSFKKWPLSLWCLSSKTITDVGNIKKAATFFVTVLFNIFMRQTLTDNFFFLGGGGVTQKFELRVSFNDIAAAGLHSFYLKRDLNPLWSEISWPLSQILSRTPKLCQIPYKKH